MTDHIMVIHRWRDRQAHYERYVDHAQHRVTYVCTPLSSGSVPGTAAASQCVASTDDPDLVRRAAGVLVAEFGVPERIVALNEGDLDVAAALRAELGCPGQHPDDLLRFRDKLVMNRIVADAGVPTMPFAEVTDAAGIGGFAAAHGWPLIVKPRRGTASRGVLHLSGEADLPLIDRLPPEPRMVQQFCADAIYHVDGVWTGSGLGPWRASRYLNTCVDFTVGAALGSVEVDDARLLPHLGEVTARVAAALSTEPWVFHLEVFVGDPDGDRPRITFLEVGYRVGGAEIPFVWREVHGYDLAAAVAAVQLGAAPPDGVPGPGGTAGWLLVPTPVPAPCRVLSARWDGPEAAEGPYAAVVPEPGYVIPRVGGYEHVGARFRFRGDASAQVERQVQATANGFHLDCRPE